MKKRDRDLWVYRVTFSPESPTTLSYPKLRLDCLKLLSYGGENPNIGAAGELAAPIFSVPTAWANYVMLGNKSE